MEFKIEHTWNSFPVSHDPVMIRLTPENAGMLMEVSAPFFNDPPAPPGEPGKPFSGLWDYEVVEAFFLNGQTEQYLEVELCPHGQHLVLLLSGRRKVCKKELPLAFQADINWTQGTWHGTAIIPWKYFPPGVDKMNSYAIHGSGLGRTYEALYPVPREEIKEGQGPNFHLLEYFKDFNLKDIMGEDWNQPPSDSWP
ncbi:UPF0462 protein C4orf33 homolog isoform X9 [Hemicordylus capensis]|uniref:UPF0462 protein C4orf33 homolog isoform X9 n=1 Tax=Hemicordylus capensis TaxID=884348 RepID=UPI002304B05D|nr:UPF0462 protein C4orf33 homolog isoform X9 [Hemicordylus capensis]